LEYRITSREYLARAKKCLDQESVDPLFYAAFELRSGIEARMSEYLEVWDHISKKKKKGWRIAELGRNVEEHFKTGNKIVRWAVIDKESGELVVSVYYTPVTSKLRKAGEKLGNYLHSMKKYRDENDPFLGRLREELEHIYRQLAVANKGTLLGPPLLKSGTGEVDMKLELPPAVVPEELFNKTLNKGKEIQVKVSYHANFPKELEKEAHVWEITS
jgi:hypothetical protein